MFYHKMKYKGLFFIAFVCFLVIQGCKLNSEKEKAVEVNDEEENDYKREKQKIAIVTKIPEGIEVPLGMKWIPGGTFYQGAVPQDNHAMAHEKPQHRVTIQGFFMDSVEVTNAQFKKFVKETKYITLAERKVDWETLKAQLPSNTPRPHDSILQPGSLVFIKTTQPVSDFRNYSQWWSWKLGANWRHPKGPGSSIVGKDDFPVVHIAYEDALAYCKWAKRRLPTEAEWEYAARGGKNNTIFFWGDDKELLHNHANTWTGTFPVDNDKLDGAEGLHPVAQYPFNGYGLYDMAGNVWEWTQDWYNSEYYNSLNNITTVNPQGPKEPFNPFNPYAKEKVIKGGSYLCSSSYCASYRLSAKMHSAIDSSTDHIGFRTVKDIHK